MFPPDLGVSAQGQDVPPLAEVGLALDNACGDCRHAKFALPQRFHEAPGRAEDALLPGQRIELAAELGEMSKRERSNKWAGYRVQQGTQSTTDLVPG